MLDIEGPPGRRPRCSNRPSSLQSSFLFRWIARMACGDPSSSPEALAKMQQQREVFARTTRRVQRSCGNIFWNNSSRHFHDRTGGCAGTNDNTEMQSETCQEHDAVPIRHRFAAIEQEEKRLQSLARKTAATGDNRT